MAASFIVPIFQDGRWQRWCNGRYAIFSTTSLYIFLHCFRLILFCVAAAARARERALAAHRKDEEEDEEDEGSTLVSEETNPMLDGELRGNNPNPTVAADRLGVVS